MKKLLTTLALVLLCFGIKAQVKDSTLDLSTPKTYEIGGITISGIKHLDESVLVNVSGLTVGDKIEIPGEPIKHAIQMLWAQNFFENVKISYTKIEGDKIYLDIELSERPRLSNFVFNGIRKTEADDLNTKIKLVPGDVITENLLMRAKNTILKHYNEKGFLNTYVNIVQTPDKTKDNYNHLIFNVQKNHKVKIHEIHIVGNEEVSALKLKGALKDTKEQGKLKPFGFLDDLIRGSIATIAKGEFKFSEPAQTAAENNFRMTFLKASKYIPEKFVDDKAKIIDKYNELGYRDAKLISDTIVRNIDNTIDLTIKVDEGPKYYFGNITWIGNTIYPSAFLGQELGIKKGDVYNMKELEKNITYNPNGTDVSALYQDNGYLFSRIIPIETRINNDSIDVEMRVQEGKVATINKVTISGNTRTNDHVVLREMRTRPGQLYSREKLVRTMREIGQLKYFNQEKINPDMVPNQENGTVDINWKVEETSSDQIELSGGWGYNRVIGTLGLTFNNFSSRNLFNLGAYRPVPTGDGQKVSLRLQSYGAGYVSYSASYMEPWLGGKRPNSFSISYTHSAFTNGLDKSDPTFQSFKNQGLTIGLGKRLQWPDDFFQLSQSINLQFYSLKNYASLIPVGNGNGSFNNFNYELNFGRSSTDFPMYPRSGSEIYLDLKLTPPYSTFSKLDYSKDESTMKDADRYAWEAEKYKWIEYHKWKFSASFYKEIIPKLVISLRTRNAFLGNYNSKLGNTPFERYYMGGDGMTQYANYDGREIIGFRGYENESVTPRDQNGNEVGASIYEKGTLEIRYPLSLNPSSTIYGMGFLEAGNSWETFKQFNPFDVKRSAGFGVRVFLPMFGMLGLDWGYGFDAIPGQPSANKGHFHFSINQSVD
ncbi:MAG: POTRA domain-containing protein [Bacteroidota bacterium]|nr:POTRA domain-containing protein [Bacteroidota bacterium]